MKKVALCGCGTVGLHLLRLIERNQLPVSVELILVRDTEKKRDGLVNDYTFTDKVSDVLNSDADIIIEVMGGTTDASTIVRRALSNGKSVVTANKALLAKSLKDDTHSLIDLYPNLLHFEGAVAGGIPIIRTLQKVYYLSINRIRGVMNGTCNYILDSMTRTNCEYKDALTTAQKKGYAEADPYADVSGTDAYQKLSIVTKLAFGVHPYTSGKRYQIGIEDVRAVDIAYAREMGCVIRHLCNVNTAGLSALDVYCLPVVLPESHELVVSGPMNSIQIDGEMPLDLQGKGAGGVPTACAVYSDLVDALSDQQPRKVGWKVEEEEETYTTFVEPGGQFFIRLSVYDQCGIIADVGVECRELEINIDSILQHPESGELCNFVITTEETDLSTINSLIGKLEQYSWFQSSFIALILPKEGYAA